MSGSRRDTAGIVIGGEPRIDFLPPEVKAAKQSRKTRRSLIVLVVLVVGVMVAGYAFATTLSLGAQLQLAAEQDKTEGLLQEQSQYQEVRTTAAQTVTTKNARLVGAATEIDWKKFLESVQGTLPSGLYIESFSVEAQNPFDVAILPDKLLQEPRVGTLTISAISRGLPQLDRWLNNLAAIPGFADATITSAVRDEDTGLYEVSALLNISSAVFENRYFDDYQAGAAEPVADTDSDSGADSDDIASDEEGQ